MPPHSPHPHAGYVSVGWGMALLVAQKGDQEVMEAPRVGCCVPVGVRSWFVLGCWALDLHFA